MVVIPYDANHYFTWVKNPKSVFESFFILRSTTYLVFRKILSLKVIHSLQTYYLRRVQKKTTLHAELTPEENIYVVILKGTVTPGEEFSTCPQ